MAKICAHDGCNNPVFSKGYCKYHAPRKPIVKKAYTIAKKSSATDVQELLHKCDYLFSRYIRQSYADNEGQVKCFTCDKKLHWKDIQLGHYLPRANYFARFDFFANRPQCEGCNVYKNGNYNVFTERLKKENSVALFDVLSKKNEVFKLTPNYLEEIRINLTTLLRENGYEY
jgi:hypothetical protein